MKRMTAYVAALAVAGVAVIGTVISVGHERAEVRYQCQLADFAWTRQLRIEDKRHDRLHGFLKARLYALGVCL